MRLALRALAPLVVPVALAGQTPADTVELNPVVVTATRIPTPADGVAGVVQICTRGGGGAAHGSLAARRGTYGSGALDATLSGGDGRESYALSVSRFSSDGLDSVNNQFQNEVFSARARYHPDGRTDAALSIRYGDALYHFPRDYRGVVVSNNQHQLERGPSVGLDLGHAFSDRVESRLTAAWRRANYQYAIEKNGPADTINFPFASSDWITRVAIAARAKAGCVAR